MTVWWQGRLVGFDVESTSAEPETARIVTAAVVAVGAGLATESMTLLVNPGVPIEPGATEVHGITNEHAQEHGLPAADAVTGLLITLETYLKAGAPLVAFRAPFDLTILDREARRYGLAPLQDRAKLRVIDPFVLDKHLDRYRKGSRKLDAICAHRDATLDGAHDAAYDALAAARLAYRIGQRGEIVRRVRNAAEGREKAALKREWEAVRHDLDLLHEFQARIAYAEAVRLAEYFRSQGQHEDAAGVRPEWPVVPVDAARAAA